MTACIGGRRGYVAGMLFRRLTIGLLILCGALVSDAPGQVTQPATSQSTTAPASQPTTAPAFSLANISAASDETAATLRDIDAKLSGDPITQTVEDQIGLESQQISGQFEETQRLLSPGPSLETLRGLEEDWGAFHKKLKGWLSDLSNRQNDLDENEIKLFGLRKSWQNKLEAAHLARVGPEVKKDINDLIEQINARCTRIDNERTRLLTAQDEVYVENAKVEDALKSVRAASARAWDRLLAQDSPPLWSAIANRYADQNLSEDSRNSFRAQWTTLTAYVKVNRDYFLLHFGAIAALAAGLIWMRRRTRQWTLNDPAMERATLILQMPIAMAIVVTIIFSAWVYPQAPRLFWAIFGTVSLIPTIYVLRRLLEKPLIPLFYALAVWCFLNLIVSVTASLPALSRVVFVIEMLGESAFFLWFLRSTRKSEITAAHRIFWRVIQIGVRIAFAVTTVAALANIFGYVSFSRLLGAAIFTSVYLGVLLDATVRIVDAMLFGLSHLYPFESLGMIRRHRDLLLRRTHYVVVFAAVACWTYFTLESVSLWHGLKVHVEAILFTPCGFNRFSSIDLGDILYFLLVIVAAFAISRFVNFLLDEDVYPRFQLARGVPYAISTLSRYVILLIGFFTAIWSLGGDTSKLTILASAFTLGIGFGLQNIVNNFVSGLIMLFERPIQVGDVVQVDDLTGVVSRIGIRASIIRTTDAAEIIMPNGNLISNRVINWTLSNRQRGVTLPLTIAASADPQQVIDLLIGIAKGHPLVAASPTPQAYFTDMTAGGMKFELRAWTNRYEDWPRMRSDLSIAVNAMLKQNNLELK